MSPWLRKNLGFLGFLKKPKNFQKSTQVQILGFLGFIIFVQFFIDYVFNFTF